MGMADDESLKDISLHKGRGGARPGAGRPLGKMEPATIERMKVKQAFLKRINKHADDLFNAQYDLAVGEKYLMVKKTSGSGKDRKTWVEVVTDIEIIKEYLDDFGETLNVDNEEYYYMTTKPANGMALDSLLNRSFGKAEEKLDLTTNGETLNSTIELTDEELRARYQQIIAAGQAGTIGNSLGAGQTSSQG